MSQLLLFVQLPQLDNVVAEEHENLYLAAAYLEWAVRHSPLTRHLDVARLPPELDEADDHALLAVITNMKPRFIACTLYLWNIERTIALMRRVRKNLPEATILFGGPETAPHHPLLFTRSPADVVTVGEGERVLPEILAGFLKKRNVTFTSAWYKRGRTFRRGTQEPSEMLLADELPPPGWPALAPNARGMAYVETSRGCPMHCTYCRYHHLRRRISLLEPADIAARIRQLRDNGAREIRFVDPTFNTHPHFQETLRLLADVNRDRKLAFFAELRADRLTPDQAALLGEARFTDIEAGVQSLDPVVLKAIGRPADPERTGEGIRLMAARGIRVTLDLMVGLPYQTRAAVDKALDWALTFPKSVNIQCMHTLMLPGTELRRQAKRLGMHFDRLPPYAVQDTPWMSRTDFLAIEERLAATARLRTDIPTQRLVGRTLLDLFPHPILIPVPWPASRMLPAQPRLSRQAWIFRGIGLFEKTDEICALVRNAIRRSPHTLWQFVLEPETEEPLDMLDALIRTLRQQPPMILDRYAPVTLRNLLTSRRIFIRLKRGRLYDPDWIEAAKQTLESSFF